MNPTLHSYRSPRYATNPFAHLGGLGRELDRILNPSEPTPEPNAAFAPAVEVRDEQESFSVQAELPGLDKENVSVTFHDGVLSISGERKVTPEAQPGQVIRSERYYGRFLRRLAVNQPVDADKIQAAYKDGILTVTLPKRVEARPRSIQIQAA